MLKNKKRKSINILFTLLFLVTLLFLSACTIYPISPNNTSDNGNIQVYSEPAGALIYLNGSSTGYLSPKLIKNVSAESCLVTLKLEGYLDSNNFVQVYPNQTAQLNVALTPNPYLLPEDTKYLTEIEVKPAILMLLAGEKANIASITAYYSDKTNKEIAAGQCFIYSTKPEVASISVDGKISALSEGQTNIWVEYRESNIIKRDNIAVNVIKSAEEMGNLTEIVVLPSTMFLSIGESKTVSSITAYFDSGAEKIINPDQCSFSTDNSVVSVDNSGLITGNSSGNSIVIVTYSDNGITKNDTISVSVSDVIVEQPEYRALAVGIGNYINYGEDGDLIAPPYDVNKVKELFYDCQFGSEKIPFNIINELKDTQATKPNILHKIQSVFSGANDNDVSYFYFSGHGATLNQVSYLCAADFDGDVSTAISVHELESILSDIPGIKVVLIDSCHSGGFIGKGLSEDYSNDDSSIEEMNLSSFNENVISAFMDNAIAKDLLTSSEYQVLTSSHWYQSSYELNPTNEDPFGVFTKALYEGCSLNNSMPADINLNDQITLQEAYNFISQWVAAMRISQDVQIYPANSSFNVFEY